MNKNLVLAVGILALIALSVWFFTASPASLTQDSTASSTAPATTTKAPAAKQPAKPATGIPNSQTSYKSLLTQAGSYQCDYEQVQASGRSSNVIYLYGGKMRGEFRSNNGGNTTSNLFVYDGQYLYQWREGTSAGTKTELKSLSQLPFVIPKDLTSGAIAGNNYESVGWLCHTWLTNKSLLAPPSYVTFR